MRLCIVKKCKGKQRCRGYCQKHYVRWVRHGSPHIIKQVGRPPSHNKIKVKCASCNKEVEMHPSLMKKISKTTCSKECFRKYMSTLKRGELNPRWNGGISPYPNHALMKHNRLIILLNNPKCQYCDKLATTVHHKDFNKANHSLDNLAPACHRCNSKLRDPNKPNTSKYRRIYGKTLADIAKDKRCSIAKVFWLHKKNKINYLDKNYNLAYNANYEK